MISLHLLSIINQHVSRRCFLLYRLDISSHFHNQKRQCWYIFFLNFVNISDFHRKFCVFKIMFSCKIFVYFFLLFDELLDVNKCLTKEHFKHSLLSISWILFTSFPEWAKCFGNLRKLLPLKAFVFKY